MRAENRDKKEHVLKNSVKNVNYLGIDYGEKRIGLSYADELGIAVPLPAVLESSLEKKLAAIRHVVESRNIHTLVIGYPYHMDGSISKKAKEVDDFIIQLAAVIQIPIHRIDERLTSAQAIHDLTQFKGKRAKSIHAIKKYRQSGDLDSRAAALILQDFIEQLYS